MTSPDTNRQVVMSMWWSLYQDHDYDAVGAHFAPDGHYTDMATTDVGGTGPEAIAARLRIGLEPLKEHFHNIKSIVADGNVVVTEHVETWVWDDENRVELPFVSMMELRDGKIVRWWDYWNLGGLMDAAPDWWLEHIMKASSSAQ